MKKPDITPAARKAITRATASSKRLRADLLALNIALTVEGGGTLAERLAHNTLLDILDKLGHTTQALYNLAEAVKP